LKRKEILMTTRRRWLPRLLAATLLTSFGSLEGCKNPVSLDFNGTAATATSASISISSTDFTPGFLYLRPGGTLTFENKDVVSHATVSDNCSELNGISITAGSRQAIRMPSVAKTCGYRDERVPTMTGVVQLCSEAQGLFGPCR